jgi:hypothetical protein
MAHLLHESVVVLKHFLRVLRFPTSCCFLTGGGSGHFIRDMLRGPWLLLLCPNSRLTRADFLERISKGGTSCWLRKNHVCSLIRLLDQTTMVCLDGNAWRIHHFLLGHIDYSGLAFFRVLLDVNVAINRVVLLWLALLVDLTSFSRYHGCDVVLLVLSHVTIASAISSSSDGANTISSLPRIGSQLTDCILRFSVLLMRIRNRLLLVVQLYNFVWSSWLLAWSFLGYLRLRRRVNLSHPLNRSH